MKLSEASPIPDLENQLKKNLSGEVRCDLTTRILYSTDASIYQIEPLGVVFPRTLDELSAAVEICAGYGVPVLARGAGSSLAGQAIGPAMILDCSRHLNQILALDLEAQTVTVEPGLVLQTLNRSLKHQGFQIGPDPASAERATLGGSIANNATGAHSILYGMMADHLVSVETVLADGSVASFSALSEDAFTQRAAADGNSLESRIFRCAQRIRSELGEEIRAAWPRVWRRASGYNLNYLLPWSPGAPPRWADYDPRPYPPVEAGTVNLAPLLAGSEGTLGVIRRATLRIVPMPAHRLLAVLGYEGIGQACDAVPALLEYGPTAVELIPRLLIDLARSVPAYAAQAAFVDSLAAGDRAPEALLVLEFAGNSPERLRAQAGRLAAQGRVLLAESPAEQSRVWGLRKVGLGILQSQPGDTKGIGFIEDLAVPVENLGTFAAEMERLLAEHGTTAGVYAHASAGCLHIRPLLNLKSVQGRQELRRIAQQAVELTLQLGGAPSGEHGDGLARSEWLEKTFGPRIYQAFRDLKAAADPHNLLNPGKIVNLGPGSAVPPMGASLRYEPDYSTAAVRQSWVPVLDFSAQAGLDGAVEQCNGAGVCRKADGVMCPSFQATQEEMHSTRGRANLLRALLSGRFPAQDLAEKSVYEALDLCLACKGCKAECPSAVDMAKLKYEFEQRWADRHGRRVRDYLFAYIDRLAGAGHHLAPLANPVLRTGLARRLADRWPGIAGQRSLPQLAGRSLHSLVRGRKQAPQAAAREHVLFLSDAFTEYFQPQVGLAAIELLERAGCRVTLLPVTGAGRTLISKGFLREAKAHAERVLKAIAQVDPQGALAVVGVEPSEIYTLRDEYLDFFPGDEQVQRLVERAYMVDEFLVRPAMDGTLRIANFMERVKDGRAGQKVLLHGHCYQKAQPPATDGYPTGTAASQALLEAAGYQVEVIDSGCCGMAGAFGYEAEHYELSMKIGELKLLPAVRAAGEDMLIAASGVSCEAQIKDGTGRSALHPVELVFKSL